MTLWACRVKSGLLHAPWEVSPLRSRPRSIASVRPDTDTSFMPFGPLPNSYTISDTRLIAGEYPGAPDSDEAQRRLAALLDAGVQTFVDLTTPDDGLVPYDPILRQLPLGALAERVHMPIPDLRVCGDHQMRRILDAIDSALDTGQTVYVHCWGGVGRTGTVIGCWLVRHRRSGQEALGEVAELYASMSDAKRRRHPQSPETEAQCRMIVRWETIERRGPASKADSRQAPA